MTEGIKPSTLAADATKNVPSCVAHCVEHQAEVEVLLPAFAWGATDVEETALVMANLARHPAAVQAVEQFSALHQAMLFSAAPVQAPAHLAQRLQVALGQSAFTSVNTSSRTQPAPSSSWPQGWWHTLTNLFAPYKLALVSTAAVAAMALLTVNGYSLRQNQQLQLKVEAMAEQVTLHNSAFALFMADDKVELEFPLLDAKRGAHADFLWDPKVETVIFYARLFPILPPEQVYQIWLTQKGESISPGTFTVDKNGVGLLLFRLNVPLGNFDAVDITSEPVGGSKSPTGKPVVQHKIVE